MHRVFGPARGPTLSAMSAAPPPPYAYLGGVLATGLAETVDLQEHPEVLDRGGWWAVLATFEGTITGYRFDRVRRTPLPVPTTAWRGPDRDCWHTSVDRAGYLDGVHRIRRLIEAGEVYQVNLCRLLSAPLAGEPDPLALAHLLAVGNPAPHQGVLHLGDRWVVTASPELFLARAGDVLSSSPIKGTTLPGEPFADKDFPENIMITDLVRNDLGRISRPGSVQVTQLLEREEHPGLAHLVSTVRAELAPGHGWADILDATFPPGSVTGAPKIRAVQAISTWNRCRAAPTAAPSGTSTPTIPVPNWRSGSARSSPPPPPNPGVSRCCISAPARASPTPPTRRPSGRRPSSRPPG